MKKAECAALPVTYVISGNSMFSHPGNVEVSDQFFGSESPSTYDTPEKRQSAIEFWKSEGWLRPEDVVIWGNV